MSVLFVDGSAGAAGDMMLGALTDLGVPLAAMRRVLARIPVDGWTLRSRRIVRQGLAGRRIEVRVRGDQPHRGLRELDRIVHRAGLDSAVRRRALEVFHRLIEAEAEVHGLPPEKTHLHEAGGVDAIVDVIGTCWAIERLAVDRIVVSPLTTGFGTVECSHGTYPVPAPATLALTRGVPIEAGSIRAERLTPTGAALLTTLADAWERMPPMIPSRIGYGAGARELDGHPNYLRLVLGDELDGSSADARVTVIDATVDDMTPQAVAFACETLLSSGALDVFTTAVTMKKGRPGHRITVLCRPDLTGTLSDCLLAHTSSFGLRYRAERRVELTREIVRVRTRWGTVRVKLGRSGGRTIRVMPEYDDCAKLARKHDARLEDVRQAAIEACRAGRKV